MKPAEILKQRALDVRLKMISEEYITIKSNLERVADQGMDGIECSLPFPENVARLKEEGFTIKPRGFEYAITFK